MDELILNENHEYYLGGKRIPGVSEILKEAGFVPEFFNSPRNAFFGTQVHRAIAFIEQNIQTSFDPAITPYINGWTKAKADLKINPVPKFIETSFASKTLGYAGTPDIPAMIGDDYVLIDLKTGDIQPTAVLQCAAYCNLLRENCVIKFKKIIVLKLLPDTYKPEFYNNDTKHFNTFLSALNCYRWKDENRMIRKENHD